MGLPEDITLKCLSGAIVFEESVTLIVPFSEGFNMLGIKFVGYKNFLKLGTSSSNN